MPTDDAAARVLAGQARYDDVSYEAQALVRAAWDSRVAATLERLDLTDDLRAAGKPWAEADENGNLVMRDGAPPTD